MSFRKHNVKLILLATSLACSAGATASHHFESAAALQDPSINQLDNYVFQSSRADATSFIMDINPSPNDAAGGVFKPGALYNIHIADDSKFKTGHTFSVMFDEKGNYTVYDMNSPNAPVGTKGKEIGKGELNKKAELSEGIHLWAGVVKDPFFGNSPGLHILRQQLSEGTYDPGIWTSVKGKNIFTGRKCGAIVLDVPNTLLGKKIEVFMTTAVQKDSNWKQVQYSAIPLFSHSMLFENEALKTEHNMSRPDNSQDMKNFVSARTARASTFAHSQKEPQVYGDKVASMLVPDVITYNVGTPAKFSAASINGRSLSDDAMSEMLTLLLGQPTDQHITDQKLYTQDFPYLIPASLK
ncbi:DUF4331 family protein [Rahnella ecdela]|uniref:DUF4331 family protein n=1 Tax=Rahnella ecdela TaxID=2816250 RepID=A0ABS6L9R9_9GAMM|nr:DUF4331 family protein [Rahnella ecdela]MBU9843676.1 DUF4331 family protein [Rahnella ecdela]